MNPNCLRCKTIPLNAADHAGETQFFQCRGCGRCYALSPGKQLAFRWGHPISLALYPVMFAPAPTVSEQGLAAVIGGRSPDAIKSMLDEITLELDNPTQKLGEIIECAAPEEALRDYLRAFCLNADKLGRP